MNGEACAICTSSTSITIDTLIGKTIDEVIDIYQNFSNMIDEKNIMKKY
ncbi:MAG: iron-sulfur cluster assembly scaffold protein [Bacilli bacterium]